MRCPCVPTLLSLAVAFFSVGVHSFVGLSTYGLPKLQKSMPVTSFNRNEVWLWKRGQIRVGLSPELVFEDRFDRWRFLQDILDNEVENDLLEETLFRLFQGVLQRRKPRDAPIEDILPGEISIGEWEKLKDVMTKARDEKIALPADDLAGEILPLLEGLLPTEDENKDAFKSVWDIVAQIHGEELTKVREAEGAPDWVTVCVVARLLVHYDFLDEGIPNTETKK